MKNHDYLNAFYMCVDDNQLDIFVVVKILELNKAASKTLTYNSGSEALEYLKANAENEKLIPDIILLDIQMPGMNGFEFLEEYAKLPEKITSASTLFLLSSTIDKGDQEKALADPFVKAILSKPLNVEELRGYF
ncbi:MAG: response regulator [Bacteroidia bacterium]|nr:response regulator [Bacteroidia bacterium]